MINEFMSHWGEVLFIASLVVLAVLLFLEFAKLRIDVNRLCRYVMYRDALYASMVEAMEKRDKEE